MRQHDWNWNLHDSKLKGPVKLFTMQQSKWAICASHNALSEAAAAAAAAELSETTARELDEMVSINVVVLDIVVVLGNAVVLGKAVELVSVVSDGIVELIASRDFTDATEAAEEVEKAATTVDTLGQ